MRKTSAASEAEDLARVTTEEESQCESNPWITGFKSSATGLKFALWLARVGKLEELPAMEKAAPKSHRAAAMRTVNRAVGKQETKLEANDTKSGYDRLLIKLRTQSGQIPLCRKLLI
ncbi:MAG: hypothetical protein KME19_11155 [Microcoleus vaginatus WJT46-NPBG5]|nr:hypothetical protein [Microcoleus vaginatus WJT46-NPBG5]